MDIEQFNRKIEEHGIAQRLFVFGVPNDCMYALRPVPEGYEVYYFERGIKDYAKVFASEGEALDYLLKLLLEDGRSTQNS